MDNETTTTGQVQQSSPNPIPQTPPKYQQSSSNIDRNGIIFSLIDLLSRSLTEHFWGTLGFISIIGVLYGLYEGKFSLGSVLSTTGADVSGGFNILALLGICVIVGIVLFIANKIMNLSNQTEVSKSISKITIAECKVIKNELMHFNKVLDSLQEMHKDLSNAISKLVQLISDNNVSTQQIRQELNIINSVIHKIPDRDAIINMLNIRTKVLFKDISEIVNEYINFIPSEKNANALQDSVVTQSSKIMFIEENVRSKFANIGSVFISDIYNYSKNTLDPTVKDYVKTLLNNTFNEIIKVLFESNRSYTTEQIYFFIMKQTNKLIQELDVVYNNNLVLTPFFGEDD